MFSISKKPVLLNQTVDELYEIFIQKSNHSKIRTSAKQANG